MIFAFKNYVLEKKIRIFFWNTFRVSNSLDPDQARHSVGSDLGTNCLRMLLAGATGRQRV